MINQISRGYCVHGKWQCVNLNFLVRFMEAVGIDTAAIAQKLDCSRPTVTAWLRNDNMQLSKAYHIINAFGYNLRLSYKIPDVNIHENNMSIVIKCKEKSFSTSEKRLSFLSEAITRSGLTKLELSEKVGVTRQTVAKWLKEDDVAIKYIVQISNLLGYEMECNITPKGEL